MAQRPFIDAARAAYTALGLLFGALSAIIVIKTAFAIGVAPALASVLEYYELVLNIALTVVEPVVRVVVHAVGEAFGIRVAIEPSWKHVFVILFAAFGATASHGPEREERYNRVAIFAIAAAIAFLSAVVWGALMGNAADQAVTTGSGKISDNKLTQASYILGTVLTPTFGAAIFCILANAIRGASALRQILHPISLIVLVVATILLNVQTLFLPSIDMKVASPEQVHQFALALGVYVAFAAVFAFAITSGVQTLKGVLGTYVGVAAFFLANAGLAIAGG